LRVDLSWLRLPTPGGGRVAEDLLHFYYDTLRVIGKGADSKCLAPLAGLVGKEGVDVGAKVGIEVVFRFLDFEALAYFKVFQDARVLEPVVTRTGRPNPKAIFAAGA
jgi:hypothetical protein